MANNVASGSSDIEEESVLMASDIEEDGRECCIFKVPINLREVNDKAYSPQMISIGPFHCYKTELADMNSHKKRYRDAFCQRITPEKWEELNTFIEDNEEKISRHYSDLPEFPSDQFVKMILSDSIFIIELFLRYYVKDGRDDILLTDLWLSAIRQDLQLLENQVPYFLLEELYNLAFPNDIRERLLFPSFRILSCTFFRFHLSHSRPPFDEAIRVKHFTDLCRHALVSINPLMPKGPIDDNLPNVVRLQKSGVKLNPRSGKYLVDIKLEKSKRPIVSDLVELNIPRIDVYDDTECFIRNLMALELCYYPSEARLCSYIRVMDFLINNERVVDLLVEQGIIWSHVGSNAVIVDMFNKLCLQVPESNSFDYRICKDLKDHYNNDWNHTIADLISNYFSNLWRGTATVVAIILLLLAFTQTVCSILQVVLPK